LRNNTTASDNTAVGYQAAFSNTTGSLQVAVGTNALRANTTGQYHTAVGYQALFANTTGNNNTAVGLSAMQTNTTGSNNSALGFGALSANTTASSNTAVGYEAGKANTTGQPNTAIGAGALVANTTGANNVAVGGGLIGSTRGAMDANTTGSQNTAMGVGALSANTTASSNTAVGYQAGYNNTTGTNNVYLGIGAGYSATTASDNCMAGYYAGELTTGGGNAFFGKLAGYAITSGTKNTIIGSYNGNQGGLDIRTASNYIVLSDGDGNPVASCADNRQWTFGDGVSSSGLVNLLALAATNNGPALIGRTGSYGSLTARWYIGSDSWVKGGTDYDSLTIASGSAASGGVKLTSGATSWVSASDARLKTVTGSYDNALADISQIQAVKFTWKHDADNKPCVGVIAQSVAAVVPEAVDRVRNSKEDETEYLGVRYTELIPLMIASIQELKAEFDAYKATHP
jgi:hypothetical protein